MMTNDGRLPSLPLSVVVVSGCRVDTKETTSPRRPVLDNLEKSSGTEGGGGDR